MTGDKEATKLARAKAEGLREAAEIALANRNGGFKDHPITRYVREDLANTMANRIAGACRTRATEIEREIIRARFKISPIRHPRLYHR